MDHIFLKKFKYTMILLIALLFMPIVTSCTINNIDEINNPGNEKDNSLGITESEKKIEELKGIVVDGEIRYYNGELVNRAKQLIKNSLISNNISRGIGFSVNLEDNIDDEGFVTYCKVYDNEYGFKSIRDIEQFLNDTYSNEEIIYETIHIGDIPLYKDFEEQLYVYDAIHSASNPYVIKDWFNIYVTDLTENTAVINYPLYYFRDSIDGVKMYKSTISKIERTWLLDNILEAELIELDETTKKTLGIRSIAIDRIDDLQLTRFIRSEGESIELDGDKYTNIGFSSDGIQFESYTNENLSAYYQNYTSNIYNTLMPYFKEIEGKLYVKNIEKLRKEYIRDYKYETLEVLSVNNEESSLKIDYLDSDNNEKTLNFKMYSDPERSWIWYSDTIL